MFRLLTALLVLAVLAAAVALVPLHGRTLLERWNAAPTPKAFLEQGAREARNGALGLSRPGKATLPSGSTHTPRAASRPVENHTDEDRAALDRIVADHARP